MGGEPGNRRQPAHTPTTEVFWAWRCGPSTSPTKLKLCEQTWRTGERVDISCRGRGRQGIPEGRGLEGLASGWRRERCAVPAVVRCPT